MRFSYVMLPDYPLTESMAVIKKADELGFYAVYAADETWHKDLWLLFAAAAAETRQIRMGPSLSAITLREPTLIAQAAATLDELTGGRAEVVLGSGNFGLLSQYKIDWNDTKPLSRTKEGLQVLRTFLDDGAITFDGEFFKYQGLFTFARPVQERLPVKMGAMRGPKSFEVAAEFSDGCHHALSYTREAYDYMVEHCRIGAERAGKQVDDLDLGAGWSSLGGGLSCGQAGRPQHGRDLRVIDAARAAAAQRGRPQGPRADHRRDRRGRPGQRRSAHLTRARRQAVHLRNTRGVRGEDQVRDRARRHQPHDPGDHRRVLGQGFHRSGLGRSRHEHAAPVGPRQGDARLHLMADGGGNARPSSGRTGARRAISLCTARHSLAASSAVVAVVGSAVIGLKRAQPLDFVCRSVRCRSILPLDLRWGPAERMPGDGSADVEAGGGRLIGGRGRDSVACAYSEVRWRRPPVLALAALPGTALGRLGEPSTASAAAWSAWAAAGATVRMLHDAPQRMRVALGEPRPSC